MMKNQHKSLQNIDDICHKKTATPLELIFQRVNILKQTEQALRKINHPLLQYCQVANFQHYNLTLHTQSSQILTELRLIQNELLLIIKQQPYFRDLVQIHFKLFFPEKPKVKPEIVLENQQVSIEATQRFEKLLDSCDSEKTKAALQKFIQKHGKISD
jgi:hypothetical protein